MNDQQYPYDPYARQPQIIGYDEYGQPVYQQPQQYDPYAQQQPPYPEQYRDAGYAGQGEAYPQDQDPYRQQGAQGEQGGYAPYDPYGTGGGGGYGGYSYDTGTEPAAVDTAQQWNLPQQGQYQQQPAPAPPPVDEPAVPEQRRAEAGRAEAGGDRGGAAPGQRGDDRDYRTEQFAFIEEPDEDSEDVIDWLKFTESRSERREEAKRRGRNRIVALAVTFALVLAGGVGYLWYAGKLPGMSDGKSAETASGGAQKRDVIVVHLHSTKSDRTSTALLVDNVTTKHGTTVLLPNTLSVANDDGTATTLGKSVEDDGSTGTREAIGTLLGAEVSGTWRLDTPYLENLVELVGTIDLTTDTGVPGAKKGEEPLVREGENQTLDGRAAVAYATHLNSGEPEQKQLQRFGQVMQAVLKKLPDDPGSATVIVETLGQILEPPLDERALGTSLAKLAEHAKGGDYTTAVLPVQQDGTLTEQAASSVVKDVLGGSVTAPEPGSAVRVGIRNATGEAGATEQARISLVNGGYTVIDGGKASSAGTSQVTYADEAQKPQAEEVAKTLGLPAGAVQKGKPATNADVSVVLGSDYEG